MYQSLNKTHVIRFFCCIFPIFFMLSACSDNKENFTDTFFQQCKDQKSSLDVSPLCECTLDKMLVDHTFDELIAYKKESDVSPLYSSLYNEALLYCELQTVFQTTCENSSKDIPLEIATPYCACSYRELVKYFSPKELNDMHKGTVPVAENFIDIYSKTAKSCLNESLNASFTLK